MRTVAPIAMITVGPPGCGKTTFTKILLAGESGVGYISLNEVRRELSGSSGKEPKAGIIRAIFLKKISEYLLSGANIVIDSANGELTERRQLIELCNQNGAREVIGVFFETELSLCLARNRMSRDKAPEHEIRRVHDLLRKTPPSTADGFDNIISVSA